MNIIKPKTDYQPKPIAIIVTDYHQEITQGLVKSALAKLKQAQYPSDLITIIEVPGAIEIPAIANQLAAKQYYAAIICFGAIIKGQTAHFEYVSDYCYQGCRQVMINHQAHLIMGVLTTYTEEQALAKINNNDDNVGLQCAQTLIKLLSLDQQLKQQQGS